MSVAAPRDRLRVRSFALVFSTTPHPLDPSLRGPLDELPQTLETVDGRGWLGYVPEAAAPHAAGSGGHHIVTLTLGDDADWTDGEPACMGNAAAVRFDRSAGMAQVWSSITGLPPVFAWSGAGRAVVTSDLGLLAGLEPLRIDPGAVVDLFRFGYPAGHRSLFREAALLPGGHALRIDPAGRMTTARAWSLPDATPRLDWPSFLEHQARTFRAAVRRMDVSSSLFSLTAGVDTRTILAVLVTEGLALPTATLSGPALSLDARVAAALSRAYSLPHYDVRLGADFLRDLPAYATEASRRSGGVTSVEEAGEVYFYRQVGGLGTRRLFGGFGNQVARQGFERVSPRGADLNVLERDLVRAGQRSAADSAFAPRTTTRHSAYERSLQLDGTLPSVGNAAIGQHFAIQQTPYASRTMIESLGRSPMGDAPVETVSRSRARLRDLGHRFFGEPIGRSFQRALIAQVGGPVAAAPINWGWRPTGGVSAHGLALGALACLDQVSSWPGAASRGLRAMLRWVGAEGLQEIKAYRAWVTDWLRDFAHDTLTSHAIRGSGLFESAALADVLREHYVLNHDRTATIIAALDVALAYQAFCWRGSVTARRPAAAS